MDERKGGGAVERDRGKHQNRRAPVFVLAKPAWGGRGERRDIGSEETGEGGMWSSCVYRPTVSRRTVTLCVCKSEFVMTYHCKRTIKPYLQHRGQLVNFSGSVALRHASAEATKATVPKRYKQAEKEAEAPFSTFIHINTSIHTHPYWAI